MTVATTVAVGGTRTLPAPDPVARDYLLLALRLDQHAPGALLLQRWIADVPESERARRLGRLLHERLTPAAIAAETAASADPAANPRPGATSPP